MKRTIAILVLFTAACTASIPAVSKDAARPEQSYVLLETLTIPTQAASETPSPTPVTPEPTATRYSYFPRINDVAYNQIPNHAPGQYEIDAGSSDGLDYSTFKQMDYALDNQHDAYFEQYVCVDYVDLRWSPDLKQPPRAWSAYGDVLHVHDRQGEWAFVGGGYWVELVYLCDF